MIGIAIAGIVLGLIVHVRVRVREEDEFALPILTLEGIVVAVLLGISSVVRFVVRVMREDETYAVRLRRNEVPSQCPWHFAPTRSPGEE
jgi:hypothetical protein